MTVLAGDVGLLRTNNLGGWAIRIGDGIWAKRHHMPFEPYNHALIAIGGGLAVQAEPGGANTTRIAGRGIDWFRWYQPLDAGQRGDIAAAARALCDTGYNWLDIAALTLDCLGWDVQRRNGKLTWIGRRIEDTKTLVCSALVDKALADAGFHLYDDGRVPGEVTPGSLARCPRLVRVTA